MVLVWFWISPGVERKHPTVLLEARTGRRIPHFVENDSRASGGRVTTVIRPLESLLPGERYIVAVRKLRGARAGHVCTRGTHTGGLFDKRSKPVAASDPSCSDPSSTN